MTLFRLHHLYIPLSHQKIHCGTPLVFPKSNLSSFRVRLSEAVLDHLQTASKQPPSSSWAAFVGSQAAFKQSFKYTFEQIQTRVHILQSMNTGHQHTEHHELDKLNCE